MDHYQDFQPQNFVPTSPQIVVPGQGDDITKFRLESTDVIGQIEHRLKGEHLVEKEEMIDTENGKRKVFVTIWEADNTARIMNDTGAKCVVFAIEVLINKIGALSNIDDVKIADLCRYHMLALSTEIFYNWDKFEVRHKPTSIVDEIMSLIELSLYRAQGAGERDSLSKIEQIQRHISEGPKQQSRFPLGRGNRHE